jgi:putative ABC transport system permease protein
MKHFYNSISFSLRQAFRTPANTILCIFVLAGCIALVTSMFRLCYVAFLWRYPYENASRVVSLRAVDDHGVVHRNWTFHTLDVLTHDGEAAFSGFIPAFIDGTTVKTKDDRLICGYSYVGWDFGGMIGVQPMTGRLFTEEDSKADSAPVAIISERLWRELYRNSPDVVGRVITILGRDRTVVGVMPTGFDFPSSLDRNRVDVWVPFDQGVLHQDTGWASTSMLFAVLKPGVSASSAERSFDEVVKRAVKTLPDDNAGLVGGQLKKLDGSYLPDNLKDLIAATSACSLMVLVMGCCIVSGLLTARYSSRMQELAIRSALGATRRQIVGLMLAEFSLVSSSAVVVGLLLEKCFETAFLAEYLESFRLPSHMFEISGGWMFAFVSFVVCMVTLASSIMPALRASRTDVSMLLKESTRTGSSLRVTRLSHFVIVTQVAIACLVICGGAIMVSKLADLHDDEKYYNPDDYLSAQFLFDKTDHADKAQRVRTCMAILDGLRKNPEIEKVGLTTEVFGMASNQAQWGSSVKACIEGPSYLNDNDIPSILLRVVSPGYFASINVPIISGREFSESDDANHQQVAAVTDVFARKYFGEGDAIGKRFRLWGRNGPLYTVVAVVPDIYNNRNEPDGKTGVFIPYGNIQWEGVLIYLKGRQSPMQYKQFLEDTIKSADSRLVIFRTESIRAVRDEHGWGILLKLIITYFSFFACGALVMVAGGLYGVISLSVNMRKPELGIRMALGADPFKLVGMFVAKGVVYVACGLFVGILGAIFLRYELVRVFDGRLSDSWLSYVAALLLLLAVSAAAIFIPASKCAYIDPSKVLRDE